MKLDPRRWGLRNKILGASALVTIAVGLVLTQQSNRRIAEMAVKELRELGTSMGESLEAKAEQLVLVGNVAGLQELLKETKDKPAILFVVVTDAQKKVLAHTFEGELPKSLADGLLEEAESKEVGTYKVLNGKKYMDVDVPLLQGALGQLHLGLNLDYIKGVVGAATRRALLTLLVVLGLGMVVLAAVLERLVLPIVRLSEVTRRIVEDGDLSQLVVAGSNDEVGVLAGHFGQMVARLRQIPLELNRNVQLLNSAVVALEQATANQSSTVNRQASALQETQVTAEEIRQTSQVAARTAAGILVDIGKAESAGEKGTVALEQSLRSLGDILTNVRNTAAGINDLGERTRQIGGITNTVKDLADQSNMLALNAAIEAVRSGEHGKGFSLVAREIRRLADQSIQSTERVREILESVRLAVSSAVDGSEEGARRVEGSLDQMRASAEHLRALANVVADNSNAVRQIATAVEQQNTGVNQVFAAVVDQSKMMEETVKQLDATRKTVDTLKEVTSSLSDVLIKYKV
jgi:methyl-accepting chemotaxis protein